MVARYRNLFLFVGVAAIVVMLLSFDMSWAEVWTNVSRAGIWFPAVLVLWFFIYMINARSWQIIINEGSNSPHVGFWRVFKYTVSGYALNSVTPIGLLGGEPYRIMELSPYVGKTKAASSVILYAMMHIFSHFCFWLFSIVVFLVIYWHALSLPVALVLLAGLVFCLLGFYFFLLGYRDGLAVRTAHAFARLPWVGRRVRAMLDKYDESLHNVDHQIAALHAQRRTTFYRSLLLEFVARLLGCFEIQFILFIFTPDISYWDCLLMQAFTSLFANLFFFIPMQMGTKEGGLAIVVSILHMNGAYGVLTGLITRLRELFWIAVGLIFIRLGNKKQVEA